MCTEKTLCAVTRTKCVLFTVLLAVPITLISLRELEYQDYDLTSTEHPPAIRLPTVQYNATSFSSNTGINGKFNNHHYHNATAVNTSKSMSITSPSQSQWQSNASSVDAVYRGSREKLIAFERYLRGQGKIIIIHLRKAGGTTLENWFVAINTRLQQQWNSDSSHHYQWNSTVEVREAYHFFHKIAHNNITKILLHDPYSIYVTSLRHPIERILSQYEFEWRWSCQRCDYKNAFERYKYSNMTDWTFMSRQAQTNEQQIRDRKYAITKYAAIDFNDWLHRLIQFEINNHELGTARHNMLSVRSMYINNYFLWICCCTNRWCNIQRDFIERDEHEQKIKQCFQKSVRILRSLDIVFITEWLNDLRTQVYVNQLFFNSSQSHIEHASQFIGIDAVNKPYPHHVTNRGRNYMISPQNEEILYRLNSWDLRVYQVAKSMVFERMHTVWKDMFDQDPKEAYNQLLYGQSLKDILHAQHDPVDNDIDVEDVFVPYKHLSFP